jgi:hypothetical protein
VPASPQTRTAIAMNARRIHFIIVPRTRASGGEDCSPIASRENADVEPKFKSDTYDQGEHTYDCEPKPIGKNRTHQNCNGEQMIMHVDTSVEPYEKH